MRFDSIASVAYRFFSDAIFMARSDEITLGVFCLFLAILLIWVSAQEAPNRSALSVKNQESVPQKEGGKTAISMQQELKTDLGDGKDPANES